MKRVGSLLFPVLAIALMLGIASANGAAQDNSRYFVSYFSNNIPNAPDATVRVINDGDTGKNLWASFYVFDDSEELTECCSCQVTPDGLLSESVKWQLTANPLTGLKPTRGVIKLVSSSTFAGPPSFTNTPAPGLRAWATHVQSAANKYPYGPTPYSQTETTFADSNLTPAELALLQNLCLYDSLLSGKQCSCTQEDYDF
jgi:hypothetical protein